MNGGTDAYDFVGATETVARVTSGAVVSDSVVPPAGERLGIRSGSTLNWLLPDPHGNLALALDASEATTVSAVRYDGYGETIASGSGGGTAVGSGLWRYQGRLDLSPAGLATPLYEFSAREYSPGLGAFTRLDSVMGDATDPLSMHRYLYAHANPATLIDPSGACAHAVQRRPVRRLLRGLLPGRR